MNQNTTSWLMGRATGMMLVAVVAGLISAQWKHEAIPIIALVGVLALTVVKSHWVVCDFMGLRGTRPRLALALTAWALFFALAALAKAIVI